MGSLLTALTPIQLNGTHIITVIQDLDIRIINAETGGLLRGLTLDPARDYQPQHSEKTEA